MSFQDISFGGSQWVGLKHNQKLASDKFFKTAVFNSVEYMLLTLLLLIPIPMMLAVLMESRLTKAKGVWKVIMYIPALTSVVISGMLFRLMFSEGDNGQMNQKADNKRKYEYVGCHLLRIEHLFHFIHNEFLLF